MSIVQSSSAMAQPNDHSYFCALKDLAELLEDPPKPVTWTIEGILPTGLALLAGAPKLGKSWLALNLAIDVSMDQLSIARAKVRPGHVLYLALEDRQKRLVQRVRQTIDLRGLPSPEPGSLTIGERSPRASEGGIKLVHNWLKSEEGLGQLVVIDTLACVRDIAARDRSAYQDDYAAIAGFKELADAFECTIMLVHHTRKMTSDDVFQMVSGTHGLTGAADTTWVLQRRRGTNDGRLSITGRDIEKEQSLNVHWDEGSLSWNVVDSLQEPEPQGLKGDVLSCLRNATAPMLPKQLARTLSRPDDSVRKALQRLLDDGKVSKAADGYRATSP